MKPSEIFLIQGQYIVKSKVRKIRPDIHLGTDATIYPVIEISYDNGEKEKFVAKEHPEKDGRDTVNNAKTAKDRAYEKAEDLVYNLFSKTLLSNYFSFEGLIAEALIIELIMRLVFDIILTLLF